MHVHDPKLRRYPVGVHRRRFDGLLQRSGARCGQGLVHAQGRLHDVRKRAPTDGVRERVAVTGRVQVVADSDFNRA